MYVFIAHLSLSFQVIALQVICVTRFTSYFSFLHVNSSCLAFHLYREMNYRSLVVVAETVFLISFLISKLIFSLNLFNNPLCLENWQHKCSVIFRNVFIVYLTLAVVPSRRLPDANSVKC